MSARDYIPAARTAHDAERSEAFADFQMSRDDWQPPIHSYTAPCGCFGYQGKDTDGEVTRRTWVWDERRCAA